MGVEALRAHKVQIIHWLLEGIAIFFVVLHFWVRQSRDRIPFDIRDWAILLACVTAIISTVCNTFDNGIIHKAEENAGGIPVGSKFVYYTSLEDAERYLRFSFASVLLYLVHMFMVKAAFLGIYWGVFQHLDNRRKMVYISVAVITGATFLASMLLQGLWCVVKGWLTCNAFTALPVFFFTCITNVLTDLMIMGLALFILSALKIRSRRELYGALFVAFIGSVTTGMTVARFAVLVPHMMKGATTEVPFVTLSFLTMLECEIGTIVACLPSLRSLLREKKKKPCTDSASGATHTVAPGSSFGTNSINGSTSAWLEGKSSEKRLFGIFRLGPKGLSRMVETRIEDEKILQTSVTSTPYTSNDSGLTNCIMRNVEFDTRSEHEPDGEVQAGKGNQSHTRNLSNLVSNSSERASSPFDGPNHTPGHPLHYYHLYRSGGLNTER